MRRTCFSFIRAGFTILSAVTTLQAQRTSIYVEPVTLTEVVENSGFNLNIGAVVSDKDYAEGVQKGADVYGLKLDVFVSDNPQVRQALVRSLIQQGETYIIMDEISNQKNQEFIDQSSLKGIPLVVDKIDSDSSLAKFEQGFNALKKARASLTPKIPKYDQILPVAFPVSPMPDDFFQPSKFPYPSPLVRVPRTNESLSATVHAHTSCNMVAQTGNMLHRTSSQDPNLLLMGMEGGNLSLLALPGAIDKPKISSVMTSWVIKVNKEGDRQILVENNGLESSLFSIGIHAPEELAICLENWKKERKITGYQFLDKEKILLTNWEGNDCYLKAGAFLVANDEAVQEPHIQSGNDIYGAKTIDFFSTQAFVQQLVEIKEEHRKVLHKPTGGILSAAGGTVGNYFERPLKELLVEVDQKASPVKPFILKIEGGFMSVTPENQNISRHYDKKLHGFYIDLRGPLTSDQTISINLDSNEDITLRRTIINFDQLNHALNQLKTMGLISGWDFEGARGQGFFANLIVYDFLGKNRKFMSSLCVWPTAEKPENPFVRFYVDGMQRLNFGFLTREGWRQEFVEVPLRIPPVPRDIDLYSGQSNLK